MRTGKADGRPTALVIGGGLVGTCCALALQRDGFATTLVAPEGDAGAASLGNAGHIATEQVDPLASWAAVRSVPRRLFSRGGALGLPPRAIAAWLPFALRLMRASAPARFAAGRRALSALLAEAMPAWRAVLDDAGARALLVEDGHIVVWERADTAAQGLARWRRADTGTTRFAPMGAAELAAVRAVTAVPVAGGIRFTGSGQIADLAALASALGQRFAAIGGVLTVGRVGSLRIRDRRVSVVTDGGGMVTADRIVLAAGVASADLLATIGVRVPMIAERGYHLHAAPDGIALPPVVYEDRSVIVTRFRDGIRVAGMVELGRAGGAPDPRKWRRLRDHADALGLPMGEAVRWMGSRPTLPDYLPCIGRSGVADNLLLAFGHQHLGLTLAAITGETIAALATGAEPPVPVAPFDIARFGRTQRGRTKATIDPL